jgi:hypothetical protein
MEGKGQHVGYSAPVPKIVGLMKVWDYTVPTLFIVRQKANLTGNCRRTIVKGNSSDLSCMGMRGRKTLKPFCVPTTTSHSRTLSIIFITFILVPFLRLFFRPPEKRKCLK